ncbi:3-oxoacyl-ACP synthase [Schinkia azotoformans]|uniref:3-oxoacyl-ACP synthase n=1 Tax=Schinkia azotoformans TaxID=1454 RepID=UPI002DBB906A|nr:3-oxoacyl-ACP synthase [Schinkia azotoformans]MEC1721768.1 3-oxoacyl-ACP synthase [Schinkia azotoformans]MED4352424.1 3-oxoacyl-ACP synthase [Schinkia azotoformans]MED4414968.1 3-oxoacyl-ACP synthase [Schinkia azotoformans]
MIENIGITATGIFFPENIETAKDLELKTGIPEDIVINKFGLYQKHVSNANLHASDMAIEAARPILTKIDPLEIDVIIYFGSPYKDYNVWPCAAKIQYELGAQNAYAFELMNVSSCFPIALKVAKDMLVSDESIQNILLVGGCKESYLIDYENPRSRFMFNFADGGAAALIQRNGKNHLLGSSIITDGSFHDDVKIPAGGSVLHSSGNSIKNRLHYLDVTDPQDMKERLDLVSVPNFVKVVNKAVQKSGYKLEDIDLLLPLHTKKSMHQELLKQLGLPEEQSIYLDHYGHMSALDPCIGLHIAQLKKQLNAGDLVVAVSAGTGYTWAATAIQWG